MYECLYIYIYTLHMHVGTLHIHILSLIRSVLNSGALGFLGLGLRSGLGNLQRNVEASTPERTKVVSLKILKVRLRASLRTQKLITTGR